MKTDSQGLLSLIQRAKELSADSELRLFACWCARQTESSGRTWISIVDLAERFARGHAQAREMAAQLEIHKNEAIAAGTVGVRARASNAHTMLAAFQTLRPDAAEAASLAAAEHIMWALNEAKKKEGLTGEEKNVVQAIRTLQTDKLSKLLQDFELRKE